MNGLRADGEIIYSYRFIETQSLFFKTGTKAAVVILWLLQ